MNNKFNVGDWVIYYDKTNGACQGQVLTFVFSGGMYLYECTAANSQNGRLTFGENELMAPQQYQQSLMAANFGMNANSNKFKVGDQVIYTDSFGNSFQVEIMNVQFRNEWCYDLVVRGPYPQVFIIAVAESQIMSQTDWQKGFNNPNASHNPTPKFQLNDTAVYLGASSQPIVGTVVQNIFDGVKWTYDFDSPLLYGRISGLTDSQLMTLSEFQNSIHNIPTAPKSNAPGTWPPKPPKDHPFQTEHVATIKKHGPTCVCGADKVKDSRHSSWCDIKN